MNIGEILKRERKKKKITQLELSKKANMSRSYIADIERDRYNPSVETLTSLARALEINLSVFFTDQKAPEWATNKDNKDLKELLLGNEDVLFDGVPLTEEDKRKLNDIMTGLFWDSKRKQHD
ncbi:helix-turn-helix domain-containing protein [Paenibacillus sp. NPDC055715]